MENNLTYRYQGQEFILTQDEHEFIERNDLWEALSQFCHEWDVENSPESWELMIECFIPFMTMDGVE